MQHIDFLGQNKGSYSEFVSVGVGSSTMAGDKKDQRCEIRFCVQQGLSRDETRAQLRRAHGGNTLSKSQINRWYARFLANPVRNDEDLPHNPGPRKLVPAKVAEVQQAVARDRRVTCRQLACQVSLSNWSTHQILHKNLKMSKKLAC